MPLQDYIYGVALQDGMPAQLAALIAAQAAHETGNFTSSVFLSCNNAFGYNAVRSACPGHAVYQNYSTVSDSVHELTAWINRRLKEGNFPPLQSITTASQYANLLKINGYYSDTVSNYTNGIERYLKSVPGGGSFMLVAGIILFILTIRKK